MNASFAWIPNAPPSANRPGWIDSDLAAYYPGDAYVDWAGADIYDFQPVSDLNSIYDFAVAHGKPFFLAEWGVRHWDPHSPPPATRLDPTMFDYVDTHVGVKAISYFNYNARPGGGLRLTRPES